MPHLPLAHHETSKRDSPNETKIKEKQNKTIPDSNSNLAKSLTHHNQTKKLTTWFLTKENEFPAKADQKFEFLLKMEFGLISQ
jgi:translation initiation factor 2 beta subunit (eIF-2beta)/eIF-5